MASACERKIYASAEIEGVDQQEAGIGGLDRLMQVECCALSRVLAFG